MLFWSLSVVQTTGCLDKNVVKITPNAHEMSTSPTAGTSEPKMLSQLQIWLHQITNPKNWTFWWVLMSFCVDFRFDYLKSPPFPWQN